MNILIVLTILLSCAAIAGEKPVEIPIPTHSVPVRRLKRMVASKQVVVAVIDTGFGYDGMGLSDGVHLCKSGHVDFTSRGEFHKIPGILTKVPVDNHGHGTNIACTIDQIARTSKVDYCIVIIKYFDPKLPFDHNLVDTIKAIKYATRIKADYINYSGGGPSKDKQEVEAVKAYLDSGGQFIAAAGNENENLDTKTYYPAMDDPRVISVGNVRKDTFGPSNRSKSSNYGHRVTAWEVGEYVDGCGISMSGTSQAAATFTGKMIAIRK